MKFGTSRSRTTFTACHREVSILNSGDKGEIQVKLPTPNSHNELSKLDSNDFIRKHNFQDIFQSYAKIYRFVKLFG